MSTDPVTTRPVLGSAEVRPCCRVVRVEPAALAGCILYLIRAAMKCADGDLDATEDATIAAEAVVPPGTVEAIYGWIDDGSLPRIYPDTLMQWHAIVDQARTGELAVSHLVCTAPGNHR